MALSVHIITPEKALEPRSADLVVLPAADGEVGIMSNHASYVCQLGAGTMRLTSATHADASYALQGGIAQVHKNEVRILAEAVAESGDLDQTKLLERLKELDAATYDDPLALAEAKAEAVWLKTQLKTAKADIPPLSQV